MSYFLWHHKALAAARLDGSFLKTGSHRYFHNIITGTLFLSPIVLLLSTGASDKRTLTIYLLSLFYVLGFVTLINSISLFLKKKKAAASLNRTVTISSTIVLSLFTAGLVFFTIHSVRHGWLSETPPETYQYEGRTWEVYHDELPLTIEDLIETDYDSYSRKSEVSESPLLAQLEGRERPRIDALDEPDLEYTIVKVKVPFLYDICLDEYFERHGIENNPDELGNYLKEEDPSLWQASKVYRRYFYDYEPSNLYIICWPDRILEIRFDWEVTEEQIKVVVEKLKEL